MRANASGILCRLRGEVAATRKKLRRRAEKYLRRRIRLGGSLFGWCVMIEALCQTGVISSRFPRLSTPKTPCVQCLNSFFLDSCTRPYLGRVHRRMLSLLVDRFAQVLPRAPTGGD